MKSYKFTIALVVLVLAFFVRPNKPNLNLSTEEITEMTQETAERIENLIQITNSSLSDIRYRRTVASEQRNLRLEAFYDDIHTPSADYILSGRKQISDEENHTSHAFVYRYIAPDGWYTRQPSTVYPVDPGEDPENPEPETEAGQLQYGPWEKQEPPVPLFDYSESLQLLAEMQPILESEMTEENYLLTYKSEDANVLDRAEFAHVRELVLREWPQAEELLSAAASEEELSLRFVVNYRDMNLQNLQIRFRKKIDGLVHAIVINSVFEQFNIVPEPRTPENAPALPV